jgi:hypothetical protein
MKVQKSESIDKLASAALCKFQGAICGVKKNAKGYGYDYTNLEAILKAIQEPLNNNGLSVVQFPINSDDGRLRCFHTTCSTPRGNILHRSLQVG